MRIFRLAALCAALLTIPGLAFNARAQTPEAAPAFAMSPLIGGDAFDLVPPVKEGTVDIAAYAQPNAQSSQIGYVVHNATSEDVYRISVVATARTPDGELFAVSSPDRAHPMKVIANGIAIGSVHFDNVALSRDLTIEFRVSFDESPTRMMESEPGLEIVTLNKIDDRIVGEAVNATTSSVSAYFLAGLCFVDGQPADSLFGTLPDNDIAPGELAPFQIDLRNECDFYLVTAG